MFRTPKGMGMLTDTSCSAGAEDDAKPELKTGVDRPEPRAEPRLGRVAKDDEVEAVPGGGDIVKCTSNSAPVGPSDLETPIPTGS